MQEEISHGSGELDINSISVSENHAIDDEVNRRMFGDVAAPPEANVQEAERA